MAKDPAVLFYTNDFLTGTFTMSNEEVGAYIRLLCLQHQKGSLSSKDFESICKLEMPEVVQKFVKTEEGTFYNVRMREEALKRENFSNSRSKNRKKKKPSSSEEHMNNICKSYDVHMENENENKNINKDVNSKVVSNKSTTKEEKIYLSRFEQFWKVYPKKQGKSVAQRSFIEKVKPSDELTAIMIEAVQKQKMTDQWIKDDGQYIPLPATWLNQRRWEDVIEVDTYHEEIVEENYL